MKTRTNQKGVSANRPTIMRKLRRRLKSAQLWLGWSFVNLASTTQYPSETIAQLAHRR